MVQLGNVFDILQFNFHAVRGRAAANPIVVQCPECMWPAAARAAQFPQFPLATSNGSCCHSRPRALEQPPLAAGEARAVGDGACWDTGALRCYQTLDPSVPGRRKRLQGWMLCGLQKGAEPLHILCPMAPPDPLGAD